MMESVLLAVTLVLLALAVPLLRRRKWIQAVDRFPGPAAWPVIGNVDGLMKYKFNMTKAVEVWTATYGDLYRIWLGHLAFIVLSKPEDLEILLSSTKYIQKAEVYDLLHTWIGNGLLTSTGKTWSVRRKMITPSFHFKILEQFVDVFNRNSDVLVKTLLATNDTVNVHSFVTLCTLDIICETAMGTRVEAQKDSSSSYVCAVHDAVKIVHCRTMKPWLRNNAVFNMSKDGRVFNKALGVLHKYTKDVIESRKAERKSQERNEQTEDDVGIKKRGAFLDQLLDVNDTTTAALSNSDIQEEVDTFMFEGHDTTAAAISFIMYSLAANPEVQERVAEEMRDIFGDSDRPATTHDIQNMHYTERVVKEALRLYPSVPLFARYLREDLPITNGYVIPAGTNVTVSCLQVGRNPKHWPDPERFDPDRFLTDNIKSRHPYAFIPFSAGPRNCIGQKFAMFEMKSSVSKMIRHCVLDLPHPGYKPRIEGQVILRAPEGVLLKVSPRKPLAGR